MLKQKSSKASGDTATEAANVKSAVRMGKPIEEAWLVAVFALLLLASIWSFWPTIAEMVGRWSDEPDYSHGFLVIPLSLFFLWSRRGKLEQIALGPSIYGAGLLAVAAALRFAAAHYFLGPLDGWTIPIWVAGLVWLVFGGRCLLWSLPAIAFLYFMIPIPFSAETMLSVPLQRVATKLSTEVLVMLGQPALAEGNTIWLGDHQLGIEEACSGLRILVGIYALAFAVVLFSRWSWWQKVFALLAALPIAIIANVTRIVVTGFLYQYWTGEAARRFMHDFSGLLMIPLAAGLFWVFLVYLDRLFPEIEEMTSLDATRTKLEQGGHRS